jgi:transcriptional regulator with XRE-family HTH domain
MSITGEQIKDARERHRMTQQELADAVGVSSRTVGSWERGESVPRSRLGAIREALQLGSFDEKDSRSELVRLIGEQLTLDGVGSTQFARRLPAQMERSFYNWLKGTSVPRQDSRPELEDALGWERGSITRILEAPITERFTLAEVRDWARVGESKRASRPEDFPTSELLAELSKRFYVQEAQLEEARELLAKSRPTAGQEPLEEPMEREAGPDNVRSLFGLAADKNDNAGHEDLED